MVYDLIIIGDACGTADPILYEGIYQARLSGKIAAEVFLQAFENDDFKETNLEQYHKLLLKKLYDEDHRHAQKFHYLLYHSGLMDKILEASYSIAQEDPEMMQSTIALFSGTETRKHSWEVMMSRKWKIVKNLGLWNSLKLIKTLYRSSRI